MSGIGAESF